MDRARAFSLLGIAPEGLRFHRPQDRGADGPLRKIVFGTSGGHEVPARFLPPPPGRPAPAVLYLHAHGARYDIGTRELAEGRPALSAPWLPDLHQMGLAVLCLEMPCFGSRAGAGEAAIAKAHLWQGRPLFGRMMAEALAGMAWLRQHPGVDSGRVGCLGISMGGTQAWWLAALEPRLSAAVSLCAFADLGGLIDLGLHDHHGPYMTVPGLLAETSTGRLAALAAPTPLFIGVGLQDWSSPPAPFAKARAELEAGYAAARGQAALQFHVEPDTGHSETPAMRQAARAFLARHLGA